MTKEQNFLQSWTPDYTNEKGEQFYESGKVAIILSEYKQISDMAYNMVLPEVKMGKMKKILYYSPFIPVIGFIIHFFWIVFDYKIYSVEEDAPKCYVPMILQGLYFGTIMFITNFNCLYPMFSVCF